MDGKKYFVFCVYFFLDCAALRCHYGGVLSLMLSSIFAMQAQRVQFQVHEGIMDFIHGGGEMVERLFLPESGILLGMHNGKLVVSRCTEVPGEVVGTVELPRQLLPVLHQYLGVQMTLESALGPYFHQT